MQELWFLHSASCLMLINIYMKFREDSLNGFQVLQRRGLCDGQSSEGNNSKSIKARVIVVVLCMTSNVD